MINLLHGDCLKQMKTLEDNSVDSIVSDPPYGISFMAKKWDYDVPSVEVWKEAMRVLKPGGHALIACGTRTQHRMVVNIEDAGFEIRDVVSWIYGSGFPKSLNISKAIDKAAGRPQGTTYEPNFKNNDFGKGMGGGKTDTTSKPITEAAKQWDGFGTALKPACEFFTLCRKPLSESTVAKNVLKWGTGGINIDGCRVSAEDAKEGRKRHGGGIAGNGSSFELPDSKGEQPAGRFPANLIHDGSQEVLELFPETKGAGNTKPSSITAGNSMFGIGDTGKRNPKIKGDNGGSAARFFYCAKASKKDREEGLQGFEEKKAGAMTGKEYRDDRPTNHPMLKNTHPTVKPTALMSYLCRLITPTGGVVLDPYMGSGSTGKAAVREGFSFVGIELDHQYYDISKARIENAFYR